MELANERWRDIPEFRLEGEPFPHPVIQKTASQPD